MSKTNPNMQEPQDVERAIQALERDAEARGTKPEIPFAERFPVASLTQYTAFGSLAAMGHARGHTRESQADVDTIPPGAWNTFVARHTQCSPWEQMLQLAAVEWAARQRERDTADLRKAGT